MGQEPTTAIFIALTNPVPGKEAEYNEWYTNTHLAEVVAVDGFISARRYKVSEAQLMPNQAYKYVAIYEVESGKGQKIIDSLAKAVESMTVLPVIDMENGHAILAESICDTVFAKT